MFIPSFAKLNSDDPLYFLLEAPEVAAPMNYCIAFLPDAVISDRQADHEPVSNEPVSNEPLPLADTWNTCPGIYLYLNVAKVALQQPTFVASLQRFLAELGTPLTPSPIRLLWLENPADPIALWRFNALTLQSSSPVELLASDTVPIRIDTVASPAFFSFRNYGLFVAGGTQVGLNPAGDGLVLTRESSNPQGFYLSAEFDTQRLYGVDAEITLPFAGAIAGCLQTQLTVQKPEPVIADGATRAAADKGYRELTALDIGFRMFFKDATQAATADAFAVAAHRYPFLLDDEAALRHYPTPLTLYPTLDPLHPLEATRTYFGFVHPQTGVKASDLPSGYCTNIGYTIHLTPQAATCRLVFAQLPTDSLSAADPLSLMPYYLVPMGDFGMSVPRYDTGVSQDPADYDDNLVCGLSGVEYIKLAIASPPATPPTPAPAPDATVDPNADPTAAPLPANLLCCRPGYPAFAPGFLPNQPATSQHKGEALLTSFATTAWAFVRQPAGAPIYYAQPEQSILHSATLGDEGDALDGILGYLEVPALALPPEPEPFPLLPYGGVRDAGLANYLQLEQQCLSPQRRLLLLEQADPALPLIPSPTEDGTGSAPSIPGTTPQGLVAEFSPDYETIQSLVLARDTEQRLLQFHNIERRSPIRAALQAPEMFWVITDPASLATTFTDDQLTIQGWTFNLNPPKWRAGTVLIFKFFDQPLIDLLENVQVWTNPAVFVGNTREIETVQQQLLTTLKEAIARSAPDAPPKDRENYGPLARIAQHSGWSGIIALNVDVPLASLPPELRALAAGIDPQRFYAQYVGIESTPVRPVGGKLVIGQSSLFGLIDYQNETIPLPNTTGYDFEVRNLRVLFQNSQVKAFSSEIAVTLDRLFDEETQLVNPPVTDSLNNSTNDLPNDSTNDAANGAANDAGNDAGNVAENVAGDRNILLLKGTAESHNGRTAYAFSFSGENRFLTPKSTALSHVDLIKAQFSTDPVTAAAGQSTTITGRFTFWGNLDFRQLAIAADPFQFDMLSFGADPPDPKALSPDAASPPQFLAFSNLVVTMSFPVDAPQLRTFAFDPGQLAFDLKRSKPRRDSLFAKFPLKFTGLLYGSGDKTIDSFGYMPVKSPISGKLRSRFMMTGAVLQNLGTVEGASTLITPLQALVGQEFLDQAAFVAALRVFAGAGLTDPLQKTIVKAAQTPQSWYALTFNLELGSLGALAGRAGFVANLVFAWNPGAGSKFFVGLRLPGSTGGKREISLQGVIKLVFKNIDLVVARNKDPISNKDRISYVLKLKNIMLKFLALSIPPNGRTEIILFGDPDGTAENNQLGWYAAYVKDQ